MSMGLPPLLYLNLFFFFFFFFAISGRSSSWQLRQPCLSLLIMKKDFNMSEHMESMLFRYNFRRRFEASHRLWKSKGDVCNNLHGHSFHVNLILFQDVFHFKSKEKGYSFPFSEIKKKFWKFVDEGLDHSAFLNKADPLAETLYKCTANAKVILFRNDPTTEEIGHHLLFKFIYITPIFFEKSSPITSVGVKIEETQTNHVELYLNDQTLRDIRDKGREGFKQFYLNSFPPWVFEE